MLRMRLDEILSSEQKLDEVPAGGLGQLAKKVGSRVLNKLPSATAKSKAANLAGQADLGDTANTLHTEFNQYLGTQGKKMAQATGEDLSAFLKTKKHSTKASIPSGVLQKSQLDNILMTVSKEAMAGQGGSTAPAQDSDGDGKPDASQPSDQKIEFVPNQSVTFTSAGGRAIAGKVVGKSTDGDDTKVSVEDPKGKKVNVPRNKLLDPKTKKPFKPGQKTSAAPVAEIPPELQQKIDALSPKQKQELASLL